MDMDGSGGQETGHAIVAGVLELTMQHQRVRDMTDVGRSCRANVSRRDQEIRIDRFGVDRSQVGTMEHGQARIIKHVHQGRWGRRWMVRIGRHGIWRVHELVRQGQEPGR